VVGLYTIASAGGASRLFPPVCTQRSTSIYSIVAPTLRDSYCCRTAYQQQQQVQDIMGDNLFPILCRASHPDSGVIQRLKPDDMDALGQEIALFFQQCAAVTSQPVAQSSSQQYERQEPDEDETMIITVCKIWDGLSERSEQSTTEAAMFVLFLKTITTSKNLQALCRLRDPSFRSTDNHGYCAVSCNSLGEPFFQWLVRLEPADTR
jgi:hypothetical protein